MPKKSSKSRSSHLSTAPLSSEVLASALSTNSGPSTASPDPTAALNSQQQTVIAAKGDVQRLVAQRPFNASKATEHALGGNPAKPAAGIPTEPKTSETTASTVTETIESSKTGGPAPSGSNPTVKPLSRARVDSGGKAITTNMGMAIGDNQNSLKAGLRGPTLLEDFVLREKLTHFDHERIPERIVHARGSAAHGIFENYKPLPKLTKAAPFSEAGKITPVFVRFSTVAGERGSADMVRDVRGFAVKFYTEAGNWDIVGNNIPVFFIQDAMKFPDLVHAVKPEPHNGMPQAASAHDTFWDFAGLMPEITHMLMWVMSDRALPKSYRTMQGFGVHTFRLVNEKGASVFVKFHWNPVAGTHSVIWDEAVKINGADSDFHRRDLWEAIEAGNFPQWELCFQTFTEEQAEAFSFDVLDATKLVPEELAPLIPVGKMTLNRNPDNFFAETEQVAFGTANIIPGIDFSNDPLLHGRHHSYLDTQLSRLGGPNFHEIPINTPIAGIHNNQRDGIHRRAIPRGRVAYEPNSLGGGCPFQAGMRGYTTFPRAITPPAEDKVRGKPEKFADHYSQATLFFNSQSPVEQAHIVNAFCFELTKIQVPAIRERVLALLANVNADLVAQVAEGLGMDVPAAQPLVLGHLVQSEVENSPMLSLFGRPGDGSIAGKKVALIVADGIDGDSLRSVHGALTAAGAMPRFIGERLGRIKPASGDTIHVEVTTGAAPAVLWDAVVLPGGEEAQKTLAASGRVLEFLKDQYRHCKPILALGESERLLAAANIPLNLPNGSVDEGIVFAKTNDPSKAKAGIKSRSKNSTALFAELLSKHRYFARDSDTPKV